MKKCLMCKIEKKRMVTLNSRKERCNVCGKTHYKCDVCNVVNNTVNKLTKNSDIYMCDECIKAELLKAYEQTERKK